MTTIAGTNPYTGALLDPVAEESNPADVDRIVESAGKAFAYLEGIGRVGRAGLLQVLADSLDLNAEELIQAAD
jgi:NADP-dependent aldehyde dehydrogenase